MQAPNQFSNGYPIIEKLYGRRLDLTYTTTGTAVSPLTYKRIHKHYENIAQWQFIQNGEKDYALNIIMRGEEPNLPSIVEMLKESLGRDANIIINKVDDIPILASGKRKPVVNNWQK